MKRFLLLGGVLLCASLMIIQAQVPQALKYKAIAKGKWGIPLSSRNVSLRFTIMQDDIGVYQENHQITTNRYGLMDVNIGEGNSIYGIFDGIDWGAGAYSLKVEIDPKGGSNYKLQGGDRLLSVPYALYAGKVSNHNDLDSDPHNEQINDMYLSGTTLYTFEGDETIITDLSSLQDGVEDADANPENEIQVLSLENNILSLSTNGAPIEIDLSTYIDNTDAQQLSLQENTLSLDNGGSVELPVGTTNAEGNFYFGDKDQDGFGDNFNLIYLPDGVNIPAGFITQSGDCNDSNNLINPEAQEIAGDGLDNDCDGLIDEDDNSNNIDNDGDGFTISDGDCNDSDASIYPGAPELCDELEDRNCDGMLIACEGHLIITEVMSNPSAVSDTYGEWFEIYNPGEKAINLNGLQLTDNSSNSHTITEDLIIYPQQSFVLGRNADININGGIHCDYQYAGFTLTNSADEIILSFPVLGEVARLEYSSAFPLSAGDSFQLDPSQYNNSNPYDPINWCISVNDIGLGDTGTPGQTNTNCESD
ncbi:MopE-related protein [Carboxylicivirga sp. N1Y90]|uniref:MopE-related protein n=1 Tax=Carboxylicivirga fragile TaxID=3417571 RepID=UPI003D339512|nr:lamin tail domain-containing protein [Marinilabiliaceae bacterium N1Y90]